jgi:hypothetical protein
MNRKTLSIAALTVLLPLAGHAAVSTIAATGWDQDIVINSPTPYNLSVTSTMDGGIGSVENNTWVEQGTYLDPSGNSTFFPGLVAGTQTSLTGNGTFTYQSFTGNNSFLLTPSSSGTLTLTSPAAYSTLALYGSTAGGPASATVKLTFSDASTSTYSVASGTGIGTDWFNTNSDRAVVVGGRASNKSEEGYTRLFTGTNSAIAVNESFFTLTPTDAAKTLSSVTVTNSGAGGKIAVFALSGQAVPEASTSALIGLVGMLGLVRRRRA